MKTDEGLEYEREAFESWYAAEYADMIISVKDTFGHQDNFYECPQVNAAWQAWLAAKYHERRSASTSRFSPYTLPMIGRL